MNKHYIYRLIRLYFLPAALLFIGVASGILAICCIVSGDTAICDNIDMWIEACSYMDFFFPLVVCIPVFGAMLLFVAEEIDISSST